MSVERCTLMMVRPAHGYRGEDVAIDCDRWEIIASFAALPDEAFSFFIAQMLQVSLVAGGFQFDSRRAIETLGTRCSNYFDLKHPPPDAPRRPS